MQKIWKFISVNSWKGNNKWHYEGAYLTRQEYLSRRVAFINSYLDLQLLNIHSYSMEAIASTPLDSEYLGLESDINRSFWQGLVLDAALRLGREVGNMETDLRMFVSIITDYGSAEGSPFTSQWSCVRRWQHTDWALRQGSSQHRI
jgi:hypothetical protein